MILTGNVIFLYFQESEHCSRIKYFSWCMLGAVHIWWHWFLKSVLSAVLANLLSQGWEVEAGGWRISGQPALGI